MTLSSEHCAKCRVEFHFTDAVMMLKSMHQVCVPCWDDLKRVAGEAFNWGEEIPGFAVLAHLAPLDNDDSEWARQQAMQIRNGAVKAQ